METIWLYIPFQQPRKFVSGDRKCLTCPVINEIEKNLEFYKQISKLNIGGYVYRKNTICLKFIQCKMTVNFNIFGQFSYTLYTIMENQI